MITDQPRGGHDGEPSGLRSQSNLENNLDARKISIRYTRETYSLRDLWVRVGMATVVDCCRFPEFCVEVTGKWATMFFALPYLRMGQVRQIVNERVTLP